MPERFCPHCMNTLATGDPFCPECGREVNQQAAAHQLPAGTVLRNSNGHLFLFGEAKGEGGFGITYIAKELATGRVVAIKEYFPLRCQPQRLPDSSVRVAEHMQAAYRKGMQSFLSEASMLHAIGDIQSIVHVLDYFEANGTAYMVMEYLNGKPLHRMLESQSRFEPNFLLKKVIPLMRDIEKIHKAGVVHRDIAPDNIMLMPDGTLKLLDFGCARSLEDGRSMTVMLKSGFAPIEQYQTRGQGPYTDVYALSATLYYCITGKIPPGAPDRLIAEEDPLIPPSALGVVIGEEQERLLLWGLSIQPTVRPGDMKDLAARWEETLRAAGPAPRVEGGRLPPSAPEIAPPPSAPPPSTPPPSAPPPPGPNPGQSFWKKHESRLLLGAGVTIVILILLILLFFT